MELGLAGKVVLVTGGSSGIGRETALAFAAEGARVALTYHTGQEAAGKVVAEAESLHGSAVVAGGANGSPARSGRVAVAVPLDLADPAGPAAVVDRVRRELGPVEVLVNNAVRWPSWPAPGELFETAPADRFTESVQANLVGPYLLARAVLADMRAQGWGRVVNVSTGLVADGFPGNVSYVAAKAGLHGLTKVMSRELAATGILTNVVMPGFAPEGKPVPESMIEQARAAAATREVTRADEVARLIVFLCSAANTNITGEAVRADGHFLTPA
ncbi:hypothetical protein Sru01_69510 [Sphaerisporangium rufum]|uniref:3-oxoacyl-[acyl-carrier protein] reductase n=1 Tax=Sphaerisporangium rufum TaxID=1381558 RepID=A0A919R9B8_9ACTN|nr:SDR family NAD(P)-dependent oxidoreductase [Sphaerisporangium rufum]GII81969.1 hypothetical protein Sru01_69510 [Sphaerisporangium rufum]